LMHRRDVSIFFEFLTGFEDFITKFISNGHC
jgi:hypothetical protein